MSEMLGNQYYLACRYDKAELEFESVLKNEPNNKSVVKKIIICYIAEKKVFKAIKYFYRLVLEDIEFIIAHDSYVQICPCKDLISEIEAEEEKMSCFENILSLALLWLFCDLDKSLYYFHNINSTYISQDLINNIVQKINEFKSKQGTEV